MEALIFTINGWMQGGYFAVAFGGCLLWGLVSVLLCPCHIAAIALIMGYVGGQGENLKSRTAILHAALFSLGIIITVTVVGAVCAALGRILGDISPYWGVPVGLLIILLGLSLTGALSLHAPSALLHGLRLRGALGAFMLGLLYGLLSGACTFGFLAPVLALMSAQGLVLKGTLLVFAFAVGHALPILAAGASAPLLHKILHSAGLQKAGLVGRVAAGGLVVAVGAYVMTTPFFE